MRTSPRTIVDVLAIVVALMVLLLVIVVHKPLRIAWHREAMERAWQESQSVAEPTESYLRYESHLEALADLGAVTKQEYRFTNLQVPTPESKHFFRRLLARDCPPHLYFSSVHPKSPEPMVLKLWYEHEFRDEWQEFLEAADTPHYREEFVAEPSAATQQPDECRVAPLFCWPMVAASDCGFPQSWRRDAALPKNSVWHHTYCDSTHLLAQRLVAANDFLGKADAMQ